MKCGRPADYADRIDAEAIAYCAEHYTKLSAEEEIDIWPVTPAGHAALTCTAIVTCQAEDQGGWPCGSAPVVFQLTEEESKRRGHQMYFCHHHRTNKFVWKESESEPIPSERTDAP